MSLLRVATAIGLGASIMASVAPALAAEGGQRLPVSYTERSLTLPKFVLNPELGFSLVKLPNVDPSAGLELGARFGITDSLDAFAVVAPIRLSPDRAYVNPRLGATYSFMKRGHLEIGARMSMTIITKESDELIPAPLDSAGVVLEAGVPAMLHLMNGKARLDAGVFLPIQLSQTSGLGLRVPVEFAYDIVEAVHVGVRTGAFVQNFDGPGDHFFVPVGIFGGFAVEGSHGPILDIDPYFTFRRFVMPGVQGSIGPEGRSDKISAAEWVLGVSVGGFFYL